MGKTRQTPSREKDGEARRGPVLILDGRITCVRPHLAFREKDFAYEVLRVLARRRALNYSAACPRASSIGLWVWGTSRSSSGG